MMRMPLLSAVAVLLCTAAAQAAAPEAPPKTTATESPPPPDPEMAAMLAKVKPGPAKLTLGHDVTVDLPAGFSFLGMPEAGKALEKSGVFHNENLLGVILPTGEVPEGQAPDDYLIVVRYDAAGYIRDDEELDANELLDAISKGEAEANVERAKKGFPSLRIDGWQEAPRYDRARHRLVWALKVSDPSGLSINHDTRLLGRRGFVSLNLVTAPETLARDRAATEKVLSGVSFAPGARYEDFDSKTDKVADYGLVGLVLGGFGIAKLAKLGLLAKFWKVIVAGLVAVFAGLKKLTGKKPPEPAA
jgi:uncharacterized membrane-anchored protein